MKKVKKENEQSTEQSEENIRSRDRYQQEIKLFFEEKKVIEDEIKNIGLAIQEQEEELKKINEKKYLHNVKKEKIEKEEKASALLKTKREIEKERWELEKKIADIVDLELEIGETIFKKKAQLKEMSVQYNLLKEKILNIEEKLVLINNKIKDIDKEEEKKQTEDKKKQEKEIIKKEVEKQEVEKKEDKPHLNRRADLVIQRGKEKEEKDKLESFFELFYNKIWLMVVTFNNDEKKDFKGIILSGGADFIPEMTEYIQTKINQKLPNVAVKIADPSINVDDSSLLKRPKKFSQFSNAIGAAMKGFKN